MISRMELTEDMKAKKLSSGMMAKQRKRRSCRVSRARP